MDEYADDRLDELVELLSNARNNPEIVAKISKLGVTSAKQIADVSRLRRKLSASIRLARKLGRDNLADALQTAVDRYF